MRKVLGLLIAFAMVVHVYGQSSHGRYASRITSDGTIFFINPQTLGKHVNIQRFEYDITLLSWTDSVTINFTIESSLMNAPENLRIISGDRVYQCENSSVLFIDIKKQHYLIRVTSTFSTQELEAIIESTSSPVFEFTQNGIREAAAYTDKAWKKERKTLSDIFQLYVYLKK